MYKQKHDGSLKVRAVPWGHGDHKKYDVRRDAPSPSLDSMRLLLSLTVENGWKIRKMDITSAILEAKGVQ